MVVNEDDVENVENISSDEEEEDDVKYETPKQQVFTIEILKLIKEAQQQHGLRHGDYQRYRCYCSRRIRRLRKALKVTQGDRRHFKRRDVTAAMLVDQRLVYIPLMMAERAWGCAMQLRQEANTEPRKRFHLAGRLRKAREYALQLEALCSASCGRCDARTGLEASAYVAWIEGALEFELQRWGPAMDNLKRAQIVYEKLASALPEEDRSIYKARVEELTPSLRYCAYNIGDGSSIDDLLQMRGQGQGDLLANLDNLVLQTREVLQEVEWRGRSVPVRPERVRAFLASRKGLESSLSRAPDVGAKIALCEGLLMDCKDAVAALREDGKGGGGGGNKGGSTLLLSYLTHIRLNLTVKRNLLMVEATKTQSPDKTEGERRVRPQDLTRLYEIILQNLGELLQLPGLEGDQEYRNEVELRIKAYRAFRCFHIAQSLVALRRHTEAVALYQRSDKYAQEALKGKLEAGLGAELDGLRGEIAGRAFSVHAQSVLEGENLRDEGTGVAPKRDTKSKKPLSDRLGEYSEDPRLVSRSPDVVRLPPEMRPIPCKPLFFDLAFNFLEFPPLDEEADASPTSGGGKRAAGITGFVKGLWGWGGAKQ